MAKIPNALTILRLALIPVFVALVLDSEGGHSWPAAIVFAVAAITDQIDGCSPAAGASSPSSEKWPTRSPTG